MKEKYGRFEVVDIIPKYWDLTTSNVEELIFLGKFTIHEMNRFWRKTRNSLSLKAREEEKQQIKDKIKFLDDIEKQAEKKPLIPCFRPCDWFEVNDIVVCCVGNWKGCALSDNFVFAKIIQDYRYKDGVVSVRCEKRVHLGEYLNGHGISYGLFRPEVMHQWEFEYLLKNLDFAEFWLKTGIPKYFREFNSEQVLSLFVKEAANHFKNSN